MWIKGKFSREHHVVCNGKTNRPSEKGLLGCLFLKCLKAKTQIGVTFQSNVRKTFKLIKGRFEGTYLSVLITGSKTLSAHTKMFSMADVAPP